MNQGPFRTAAVLPPERYLRRHLARRLRRGQRRLRRLVTARRQAERRLRYFEGLAARERRARRATRRQRWLVALGAVVALAVLGVFAPGAAKLILLVLLAGLCGGIVGGVAGYVGVMLIGLLVVLVIKGPRAALEVLGRVLLGLRQFFEFGPGLFSSGDDGFNPVRCARQMLADARAAEDAGGAEVQALTERLDRLGEMSL